LLRMLSETGYAGDGIDQSRALVRYAAAAAPRAGLTVGSIYKTPFPRCDAITATGEVFSYCSTANGRSPSLKRLFRRAYSALRPGGVLIFDVLIEGRRMAYEAWRAGAAWAVLTRVREEPRRHRLIRNIVVFRKSGSGYRRTDETHVLRTFARQAIASELRRAGFRVKARNRYGRAPLPLRRWAFVASKSMMT
jgi:SAM-dependent methyltransferase